jgi:hypothetical protein
MIYGILTLTDSNKKRQAMDSKPAFFSFLPAHIEKGACEQTLTTLMGTWQPLKKVTKKSRLYPHKHYTES